MPHIFMQKGFEYIIYIWKDKLPYSLMYNRLEYIQRDMLPFISAELGQPQTKIPYLGN